MRRALIVTFAVPVMVAVASPALAARTRAYRGETSAGTKIRLHDPSRGRRPESMKGLRCTADLLCDDATTMQFGSIWQFGGVGERLDGRRLTLDLAYASEALHIIGVSRAQTASGTFEDAIPTLTDDEQAQLCTTGELTWDAHRVPRERLAELSAPPRADVAHHADHVTCIGALAPRSDRDGRVPRAAVPRSVHSPGAHLFQLWRAEPGAGSVLHRVRRAPASGR